MQILNVIRYNFGKIISKKPKLFLFIITGISLLFIFVLSAFEWMCFPTKESPAFMDSFEHILNIALSPCLEYGSNFIHTTINVISAIVGLIFLGALIGIIASIIEAKISQLKRGRSMVIESNHSVFLGWSNKLITAVKELSEANRSMHYSSIVILSIRDKLFMEESLLHEIPSWSKTDVVCRTGDPSDNHDLTMVNAGAARSIVLLSTEDENSDSIVLKRALALQKNTQIKCPIIAEVHSPDNAFALKLLDKITVIQPKNFIMRLIAQTIKEPGLSKVYYELLTFQGAEVYFWPPVKSKNSHFSKNFVGKTFREVIFNLSSSSLIGVVRKDENNVQEVKLLPEFSYVIQENDQLIVIAEDDSSIGKTSKIFKPLENNIDINLTSTKETPSSRHVTIIGWNSWATILLEELNLQLPSGSSVDILFNSKIKSPPTSELVDHYENLKITTKSFEVLNADVMQQVDWVKTNSILILSYRDDFDVQESDALMLLAFTHVKHHRDKSNLNINICCELLDPKNQKLIEGNRDDEFITGEELIAMYLIQLSENKYLKEVYTDLLDETGAEFYLRSADSYFNNFENKISYGEIVNEGIKRNEIVVGIQDRKAMNDYSSYTSILSPNKFSMHKLGPEDKIIVLADN